jgi:hypothetical protein
VQFFADHKSTSHDDIVWHIMHFKQKFLQKVSYAAELSFAHWTQDADHTVRESVCMCADGSVCVCVCVCVCVSERVRER